MALTAVGVAVGFVSTPWEMDEKRGVSHRLSVSTGDTVEEISISESDFDALGVEAVDRLRALGQPVRCRVKAGAFGGEGKSPRLSLRLLDVEFLTLAEVQSAGFAARIYEGD